MKMLTMNRIMMVVPVINDGEMKYTCSFCGDLCFDGTTDKTLPRDISQHETGSYHKRMLEEAKRTDGDRELGMSY